MGNNMCLILFIIHKISIINNLKVLKILQTNSLKKNKLLLKKKVHKIIF